MNKNNIQQSKEKNKQKKSIFYIDCLWTENIPKRVLTNSSINTFYICPKKYDLSYNKAIYPIKYNAATTIGSAVHLALDFLKSGHSLEFAILKVVETFKDIINKLEKLLPEEDLDKIKQYARFDLIKARAMVKIYNSIYHETNFTNKTIDKEIDFKYFERVLGPMHLVNPKTLRLSKSFAIAGKSDGEGIHKKCHKTVSWELKTTSMEFSTIIENLEFGIQMPLYQFMEGQHDKRYPQFTVLDIIRKPSIKPLKKTKSTTGKRSRANDETPLQYYNRCIELYTKEQSRFFGRYIIPVSEANIINALELAWNTSRLIKFYDTHGYPAPRGTHCIGPYGVCEYKSLCWYDDWDFYEQLDIAHEELGIIADKIR